MPRPLSILLPPSEGKAPGGDGAGWDPGGGRFGPSLAEARRAVADALAAVDGGDRRLLGIGGDGLERARAANRALVGAPCLPASQRFTGVVWDHFGPGTLGRGPGARAREAVVVVSAVAGLLALDDPVPDHRLKLSVSLPPLGGVAAFWRPILSATLNDRLDGHLVIDLLPQEHAAAWTPDPDRYDLHRVELRTPDGRPGGHAAKAAKGLLARALVEARSPAALLRRYRPDGFLVDVSNGAGRR